MMMGNMSVSKLVSNHQKLVFPGLGMCRYLYIRVLLVLIVRINHVQNPKFSAKFSNSLVIFADAVHRFLKAKILYS